MARRGPETEERNVMKWGDALKEVVNQTLFFLEVFPLNLLPGLWALTYNTVEGRENSLCFRLSFMSI